MSVDPTDMHLLHEAARRDFEVFMELGFTFLNGGTALSRSWYLSAIAESLMTVEAGKCRRLIITVPPRHLKSTMASVLFPAWLLGRNPHTRIIVASYGQEIADSLTRDFRKVVNSHWYAMIFPATAHSIVRDTTTETVTRAGGCRFAAAVGGTLTGRGADYLICDDLMKAQDAASAQSREKVNRFFDETLLSRLDNKATGRIITLQQRLHEADIVAHLMEKETYEHLCLPAIATEEQTYRLTLNRVHHRKVGELLNPERESRETLDALRAEMGPRVFEAQYQQNPTAQEGACVRWHDIRFCDVAPARGEFTRLLQSWDTGLSEDKNADASAGTTWGLCNGVWHLVDVLAVRQDYARLIEQIAAWQAKWRADTVLIEGGGIGRSLVTQLRRMKRDGTFGAHSLLITPKESKEVRLTTAMERLYTGKAQLPRTAAFMDALRREMVLFPNGKHDDRCDSLSQALNYIFLRSASLERPPGVRAPGRPRPHLEIRRRRDDDLLC